MEIFRSRFRAMACECELVVAADSEAAASDCMQAAAEEVLRIETKYSRYRADSVVGRINAAAGGQPVAIDEETLFLLDFAAALYTESDGLFDITSGVLRRAWRFPEPALPAAETLAELLPLVDFTAVERDGTQLRLPRPGMEIDFGGFGKEYATDRAAQVLQQRGIRHGYVNLGGDLFALGPQPDGAPWQVGISHPRQEGHLVATLPLTRGGLATSGDYERFFELDGTRYCHVLNPRTGWPVQHWQSVSVLAPVCSAAGAWSTIAMLKQGEALEFLRSTGSQWLAIDATSELYRDSDSLSAS